MTKTTYVPPLPMAVDNLTRLTGQRIDPLKRLATFSDIEFERFVGSIVYEIFKPQKGYKDVYNFSGAGDKGRDVIGFYPDGSTDYYQCKNYSSEVSMSIFLIELAKIIYYCSLGDFPYPRKYFMVARSGVHPLVFDLTQKPNDLKVRVKKDWDKVCSKKITEKVVVKLSDIESYLDTLVFDNIEVISNYKLIELHRRTTDHTAVFGIGMLTRPESPDLPIEVSSAEQIFVDQFMEVISEAKSKTVNDIDDLDQEEKAFLEYTRRTYYSADNLRIFIRDTTGTESEFSTFKKQINDIIMPTYHMRYVNRHAKMLACLNAATLGSIRNFWFSNFVQATDQTGACHHLVIEGQIKWN